MSFINIDICVPFFNYGSLDRTQLFNCFCNYYKKLSIYFRVNNICNITFTFIGSEGEESLNIIRNIFTEYEATYHEFDQSNCLNCLNMHNPIFSNMLTNKFKFAYEMSFLKNPDVVLLNGSNDFVSYNYFQQITNFYNPNEKQLYGIDNYNNGNNFVFFSKKNFFNNDDIDLSKNKDNYFLWNGVSNVANRIEYNFCGGSIGFNKHLYNCNKDFILEKCISFDEGLIEKTIMSIYNCVKFNSKNVLYVNLKTNSNTELNTYTSLNNDFKRTNCIIENEILSNENKKSLNELLLLINEIFYSL